MRQWRRSDSGGIRNVSASSPESAASNTQGDSRRLLIPSRQQSAPRIDRNVFSNIIREITPTRASSSTSINFNDILQDATLVREPSHGSAVSSTSRSSGSSTSSKKGWQRYLETAKTMAPHIIQFVELAQKGQDKMITVGHEMGSEKTGLCTGCRNIPFARLLPLAATSTRTSMVDTGEDGLVFCMPIEKIMLHRDWCPFCGFLFRSVCQPENDLLLNPKHIQDYVQQKIKGKSFQKWAAKEGIWLKRIVPLLHEDNWPFGHSRDQKQAAQAAKTGIEQEWSKEESVGDLSDISGYETNDLFSDTAQVSKVGVDVTKIALKDKELSVTEQQVLGGAELAISQLAFLAKVVARRLTCWFVIKAYPAEHPRAGEMNIRVFGHGRAPRAPLQEMCCFKVRIESSQFLRELPAPDGLTGQLKYGRQLHDWIDIEFFARCLKSCQRLHGQQCTHLRVQSIDQDSHQEQRAVFRLIDVDNRCLVDDLPFDSYRSKYISLSYCWGSREDNFIRLTSSNKLSLTREKSLDRSPGLPRTVLHAMKVVKRLAAAMDTKYYLWVDRLCIVQDHDDDKVHNFARMDKIYSHAILTIANGDGDHMDAGLNGVETDRVITHNGQAAGLEQVITNIDPGVSLVLPLRKYQNLEKWDARAWTLQEKMFSNRLIIFANGYAVWHCRESRWHEDVNADDIYNEPTLNRLLLHEFPTDEVCAYANKVDGSVRLSRPDAMRQYTATVEQYTSRQMKEPTDILSAFRGLQQFFQSPSAIDSMFRYGLPERFIDTALLWQPKGQVVRRKIDELLISYGSVSAQTRPPPSWSWAGWESVGAKSSMGVKSPSQGPQVHYQMPFQVHTDDSGALRMRGCNELDELHEERIRPLHSYWALSADDKYGRLRSAELPKKVPDGWEANPVPCPRPKDIYLDDRHLVFRTESAMIQLGETWYRKSRSWIKRRPGASTLVDQYIQESQHQILPSTKSELDEGIEVSEERFVLDPESGKPAGTVKLQCQPSLLRSSKVEAIILSEAQFLGIEDNIDVAGYPLYNIMIVTTRQHDRIRERIGLGKMYKYAWRNSFPQVETVVLQ